MALLGDLATAPHEVPVQSDNHRPAVNFMESLPERRACQTALPPSRGKFAMAPTQCWHAVFGIEEIAEGVELAERPFMGGKTSRASSLNTGPNSSRLFPGPGQESESG